MPLLLVPIKSAQGPTLSISDKSLEETTGSSALTIQPLSESRTSTPKCRIQTRIAKM